LRTVWLLFLGRGIDTIPSELNFYTDALAEPEDESQRYPLVSVIYWSPDLGESISWSDCVGIYRAALSDCVHVRVSC